MEIIILILAPLEMLLVNLFVIHQCSERKYGKRLTYVSMGLFICALLSISFFIARNAPDFGSGNGLFVFSGFLFIIPIKLLYKVPGIKIVTIACFSWSYTFILFALSAKLGQAFAIHGRTTSETVLLLQTILYCITFKAFYGMLKSKFIYVLEHIGKKEASAFMWMSMMWFWMMFILNLSFTYPDFRLFQTLTFLTLAVSILSSFRYIYLQVNSDETIRNLEKIAYQDNLTQLRSRVVLSSDIADLIARKIPFQLIFFDLDNFKSINDRYGHMVGDQYLAFFAYEIKVRIGSQGGFYRIAGDEFVCIVLEDALETFLEKIGTLPNTLPNSDVKFLGFSYGIAFFPEDGKTADELFQFADQRMYDMKRAEKSSQISDAIAD